jgi:hypothetical protein
MNILEQLKRERIRAAVLFAFFCVIVFVCQWSIKEKISTTGTESRTIEVAQ